MTLRISHSTDRDVTTIHLEGRLDEAGVDELEVECRASGTRLRLDLSGLQSLDEAGLEALRSIRSGGAELHSVSLFVARLLEEL